MGKHEGNWRWSVVWYRRMKEVPLERLINSRRRSRTFSSGNENVTRTTPLLWTRGHIPRSHLDLRGDGNILNEILGLNTVSAGNTTIHQNAPKRFFVDKWIEGKPSKSNGIITVGSFLLATPVDTQPDALTCISQIDFSSNEGSIKASHAIWPWHNHLNGNKRSESE